MLLIESLIHGLCDNAMLSNGAAIEIVERAVSVQFDQAEAADGAGPSVILIKPIDPARVIYAFESLAPW